MLFFNDNFYNEKEQKLMSSALERPTSYCANPEKKNLKILDWTNFKKLENFKKNRILEDYQSSEN